MVWFGMKIEPNWIVW